MLRLIFVLAVAFIGSQFPNYYFDYYLQTSEEARFLERNGGSQAAIAALRRQEQALYNAEPMEMPFVFADAFDADRAVATLNYWEPQMPEDPEEWAYGGVGLVLGFLVSGILRALFGGGRQRTPTAQRTRAKPAGQVWAKSGTQARKQAPARSGSRIPVSTGNLREASRMAKEALRQARQAVAAGPDPAVAGQQPAAMERRVPTAVQRASTAGAVIPSRYRPPAITRRFESRYAGPIERMTTLRD